MWARCGRWRSTIALLLSLASSWLAFEGANFTGRLSVLEEGSYSSLKSMGCVQGTSILSLQIVGFVGVFKYSHTALEKNRESTAFFFF